MLLNIIEPELKTTKPYKRIMKIFSVSVIIPTYNYSKYILEAIKSIEAQNYPTNLIEIIIIDDGSTDDTANVINGYKSAIPIHYLYQENKGKAAATQKGIDLCNGDIIFNLDADDYFYPEKIKSVINIYQQFPEIVFVGHPADILNTEDKSKRVENIPLYLMNKTINGLKLINFFLTNKILFGGGSTFSAKATVLKKEDIPSGIDMYIDEYLIYATAKYGKCYLLSESHSIWRIHGNNYSVNRDSSIITQKRNRLLNSSFMMLNYINNSSLFTSRIKKLYYLKHLDRLYGHLEIYNEKTFKQIINLIFIIFTFKYSITDLHKYRIFYRLVPTGILKVFKSY